MEIDQRGVPGEKGMRHKPPRVDGKYQVCERIACGADESARAGRQMSRAAAAPLESRPHSRLG